MARPTDSGGGYHPAMEASTHGRIRIEAFEVARFSHPAGSPLAGRTGIVMAYAVVHPAGLLLFDTGIGTGDADIEEAYHPVVQDLRSLLAGRGLEPDDVVALACSHLHFDHAGQNAALPGSPDPRPGGRARGGHERPTTRSTRWVDFPGARYVEEDGEAELLPGVRLIPTPGHTPATSRWSSTAWTGGPCSSGRRSTRVRSGMARAGRACPASRAPGIRPPTAHPWRGSERSSRTSFCSVTTGRW